MLFRSNRIFSSFITGQCIEAVILGSMFFVSMTILHFPYAMLVGVLTADSRLADYDIPVFYTYGKNDGVIPKYELFATAAWLEEHTWLKTKSYHGLDHNVSLEEFADLRQWLLDNDITSGVL